MSTGEDIDISYLVIEDIGISVRNAVMYGEIAWLTQDGKRVAIIIPAAEIHVNYVVEARKGSRPWLAMSNAGGDENAGRTAYGSWLGSKRATGGTTGGTMEYRLVRRTAVITDEILEEVKE